MYEQMNIEDLSSMNTKQHYILNVAESLLIELACESDLSVEEIQDKTKIIGGLATDIEQKKHLIEMLQSREEDLEFPQVYKEILEILSV